MKLNKAQLEEAVREACSKHRLKQEHRAQLEELLKEKISAVFESAQSGGTSGSGKEGQKDPEYRLDKWDRSSTPGVNKKTKRMYNKKNRQAAKKDLEESESQRGGPMNDLTALFRDMSMAAQEGAGWGRGDPTIMAQDLKEWIDMLGVAINDLRSQQKKDSWSKFPMSGKELDEESDNPWPASWTVKKGEK